VYTTVKQLHVTVHSYYTEAVPDHYCYGAMKAGLSRNCSKNIFHTLLITWQQSVSHRILIWLKDFVKNIFSHIAAFAWGTHIEHWQWLQQLMHTVSCDHFAL